MKIAIYGGSFNPVHFGHIGLAKWVVEHTNVDEVWLMVSPNSPLKSSDELAPETERLVHVQQAIQGIKGLVASNFEFQLPRPSYTANTLRELKKSFPEHNFCLLIGEDNWQLFPRWREWKYIRDNYPIIVYPRHFLHPSPTPPYPSSVTFLSNAPYFDISATEIRQGKKITK